MHVSDCSQLCLLIRAESLGQGYCECGERRRVAGDTRAINRVEARMMDDQTIIGAQAPAAAAIRARTHDVDALDESSLHVLGMALMP